MVCIFLAAFLAFADQSYGPQPLPEELGRSPQSAGWVSDPEAKLKEIFKKLYEASGYKEPIDLEYRANERLINDSSPLMTRFPAPDEDAAPKIFAGYSAFEIFRNEDELAQVLAHEMSHVILDHSRRKKQALEEFDLLKWYDKNTKRIKRQIKAMEKRGLNSEKIQLEIYLLYRKEVVFPVTKKHEEEADAEGLSLAFLAGFKPISALNRVIHSAEYGWAIGVCESFEQCWAKQDLGHGNFAERHDKLQQILKDLKLIEK